MNVRRVFPVVSGLASLAVALLLASTGCSNSRHASLPLAPNAPIEVVGTLVAVQDDRALDGGIDLTLATRLGTRELVRVPSAFVPGPRDAILAMHEVVDAAKLGDRLRARGTRDETGAVRPETLELVRP